MIIANFKSNKNKSEISEWAQKFQQLAPSIQHSVVLCPPTPHLVAFETIRSERISLGVQDISSYPAGSYTGAVSTHNLVGFGVSAAIVGHSERRSHFHETNQDIANKVRECLAAGLTPIVCVSASEVVATANALDASERAKCVVAFEPIEHIGTGTSDTLAHILETKDQVISAFGKVPYIYGGSVNLSTAPEILHSPEIDGFLVGSACLDAQTFHSLIQSCA